MAERGSSIEKREESLFISRNANKTSFAGRGECTYIIYIVYITAAVQCGVREKAVQLGNPRTRES